MALIAAFVLALAAVGIASIWKPALRWVFVGLVFTSPLWLASPAYDWLTLTLHLSRGGQFALGFLLSMITGVSLTFGFCVAIGLSISGVNRAVKWWKHSDL